MRGHLGGARRCHHVIALQLTLALTLTLTLTLSLSLTLTLHATRKENSKIITDAELKLVLDRTKGPVVGKGFRAVEKVTNSFDAMAQAANAADK